MEIEEFKEKIRPLVREYLTEETPAVRKMKVVDEMYKLVRTLQIPKEKRTCENCFFFICEGKDFFLKKHIENKAYCQKWKAPVRTELVYHGLHFMTEEERRKEARMTFEEHVERMVNQEVNEYQKTLKELEKVLEKVKVEKTVKL